MSHQQELARLEKLNAKADKLANEYANVKAEIRTEVIRLHGHATIRAPHIAAVIGVQSQTVRAWWSEAIGAGVLELTDTNS